MKKIIQVNASDVFWFYARRVDALMTVEELRQSNQFYAAVLSAADGMAGAW